MGPVQSQVSLYCGKREAGSESGDMTKEAELIMISYGVGRWRETEIKECRPPRRWNSKENGTFPRASRNTIH